jgi:hypothetical protein
MAPNCSNPLVVEEIDRTWKLFDDLLCILVVIFEWIVFQVKNFELLEFFQLLSKVVNFNDAIEGNIVVSKVHLLDVDFVRFYACDAQVRNLIRIEDQYFECWKLVNDGHSIQEVVPEIKLL